MRDFAELRDVTGDAIIDHVEALSDELITLEQLLRAAHTRLPPQRRVDALTMLASSLAITRTWVAACQHLLADASATDSEFSTAPDSD